MNRKLVLLALWGALAAVGPIGCNKSGQADGAHPALAAIKVDTAKLRSAFASASGELKANLDRLIAAISDHNFSGAADYLKKMGADASLTPEQKSALNELMVQIKERTSEVMKTAGQMAGQAAEQVKEAAGKAAEAAGKAASNAADAANKAAANLAPK
jgi:ElaB/YqjD/DUF883 family membrane-anchored ribosome-binding protein